MTRAGLVKISELAALISENIDVIRLKRLTVAYMSFD